MKKELEVFNGVKSTEFMLKYFGINRGCGLDLGCLLEDYYVEDFNKIDTKILDFIRVMKHNKIGVKDLFSILENINVGNIDDYIDEENKEFMLYFNGFSDEVEYELDNDGMYRVYRYNSIINYDLVIGYIENSYIDLFNIIELYEENEYEDSDDAFLDLLGDDGLLDVFGNYDFVIEEVYNYYDKVKNMYINDVKEQFNCLMAEKNIKSELRNYSLEKILNII